MPCKDKPAFRCKTCGHLEAAEHAGACELPHSCSVCGAGVEHAPTVKRLAMELADPKCTPERRKAIPGEILAAANSGERKQLCPDNWEVLHACTPERLKELGLHHGMVVKHVPTATTDPNRKPQTVVVSASDGVKSEDKGA